MRGHEQRGTRDAEEWWAGLSERDKAVFHALGIMISGLKIGELLRLQSTGTGLEPVLISEAGPRSTSRVQELSRQDGLSDDEWWSALPPTAKRALFPELDKLVMQVLRDPDRSKLVEVRPRNNGVTISLILLLRKPGQLSPPLGGKAEAN
jgi:hypothetical protein